jgi:tripartite-type tricarboxylate transporter receptor subunit TctC
MKSLFCRLGLVALTVAATFTGRVTQAEPFPDHPVKIIVPFPAGGSVDTLARHIGHGLGESWRQNVLIDNRAGANSVIGSAAVATAPPDGYTLLLNAGNLVINQHLIKTPYDVESDFAPIALLAKGALIVSVTADLPARSFAELVALAQAQPGKLDFAIGSVGSPGHFATEMLMRRAGMQLFIVPYKGSTPAYQDLVGGHIHGMVEPALGVMPYIKAGTIRGLAVTGTQRVAALPDIPTVAEAGLPGFEFYSWYGLWAPAKTPRAIVEQLNQAVNQLLGTPELRDRLQADGFELQSGSPEDFASFVRAQYVSVGQIVREANIKAE